jgi:hypothetical protein
MEPVAQVQAAPDRQQATPEMLTRPPPTPRTLATGSAPRGAQMRSCGYLKPRPASYSKQYSPVVYEFSLLRPR